MLFVRARAKQRGLAPVYYIHHLLAQFDRGTCKNNVTYLTYIILFIFLCNLAGARARAFPSYFICLILSGSRGNNINNN